MYVTVSIFHVSAPLFVTDCVICEHRNTSTDTSGTSLPRIRNTSWSSTALIAERHACVTLRVVTRTGHSWQTPKLHLRQCLTTRLSGHMSQDMLDARLLYLAASDLYCWADLDTRLLHAMCRGGCIRFRVSHTSAGGLLRIDPYKSHRLT